MLWSLRTLQSPLIKVSPRAEPYPFISHANHANHSVFITGGARGIGKSIALSLDKAGASQIALGDIIPFGDIEEELWRVATENRKSPPRVLLLPLDVTDEHNVAEASTGVKEKFNKLDIVIQNAGYCSAQTSVLHIN